MGVMGEGYLIGSFDLFILSVSKVSVFYTEIATGDCLQCNSPSETLKVALYNTRITPVMFLNLHYREA